MRAGVRMVLRVPIVGRTRPPVNPRSAGAAVWARSTVARTRRVAAPTRSSSTCLSSTATPSVATFRSLGLRPANPFSPLTLPGCSDIIYGVQDAASGVSDQVPRELLDGVAPLIAKPRSLSEVVYDAIRSSIASKRLAPGTIVVESSLAARLRVSKTPVREALLRLESVGLVEPDGARGHRVVSPSADTIREAYEVRLVLERGLAQRAAVIASPADQEEILNIAECSLKSAEAGDVEDGFRKWDRQFHSAVSRSAGNVRLARLAEDAAVVASVLRERDVPDVQDAIQCGRQHVDIAMAICSRDAEAASRASEVHVNDVRNLVLVAFTEKSEPAN